MKPSVSETYEYDKDVDTYETCFFSLSQNALNTCAESRSRFVAVFPALRFRVEVPVKHDLPIQLRSSCELW